MGTLSDVVAPLARTSLDADARPTKIETLKNICDAKHSSVWAHANVSEWSRHNSSA